MGVSHGSPGAGAGRLSRHRAPTAPPSGLGRVPGLAASELEKYRRGCRAGREGRCLPARPARSPPGLSGGLDAGPALRGRSSTPLALGPGLGPGPPVSAQLTQKPAVAQGVCAEDAVLSVSREHTVRRGPWPQATDELAAGGDEVGSRLPLGTGQVQASWCVSCGFQAAQPFLPPPPRALPPPACPLVAG